MKSFVSVRVWGAMKLAMAASRVFADRKTPCLNRLRVSLAMMRRIRARSGEAVLARPVQTEQKIDPHSRATVVFRARRGTD
jgi:hypothetical protein